LLPREVKDCIQPGEGHPRVSPYDMQGRGLIKKALRLKWFFRLSVAKPPHIGTTP